MELKKYVILFKVDTRRSLGVHARTNINILLTARLQLLHWSNGAKDILILSTVRAERSSELIFHLTFHLIK